MSRSLLIILTLLSFESFSQNGYVKLLKNDSVLTGYLRHYKTFEYGEPGIEVWKTKKDKHPRRVFKSSIYEYAIKKDTFRVLQNFRPFQNSPMYFDMVDGILVSRGKVNLIKVDNPKTNRSSTNPGATVSIGIIPVLLDDPFSYSHIYIMEDQSSGYIRALSKKKEKLLTLLSDFFPERYIQLYTEKKGKISYKSLADFTKLYNSK